MQEIQNRVPEELSEYEREGAWYQRGLAEGLRSWLFVTLDVRGLAPDAEQRARIEACPYPKQVRRWLDRAMQAASLAEVFADDV